MPPNVRAIVELRMEGRSYAEIARRTGATSPRAVEGVLQRYRAERRAAGYQADERARSERCSNSSPRCWCAASRRRPIRVGPGSSTSWPRPAATCCCRRSSGRSSGPRSAPRRCARCAAATPAAVIADVLARAARITFQDDRDADGLAAAAVRRGDAVPVEGPIPDWLREVHRLRESRGLDPEKVLVELEGMGFSLTAERLVDDPHRGAGVPGPGAGALDRHRAGRGLDRPRATRRPTTPRWTSTAGWTAGWAAAPGRSRSPGWPAPTR